MSYLAEHDQHVSRDGGFTASVVYVGSWLGSIQIEACGKCPYLHVECEHKHNSWNADGTILTCNLCGVDGT